MATPLTANELNAIAKQSGYTGGQFSSVGLPSTINSTNITPAPQVNLPTPPTKDYNAGGILAGGNAEIKSFTTPSGAKVDAQGNLVAEAPQEPKSIGSSMMDIFQKYFPTAPKGGVDQYNTLNTQAGIDEKTTAFNESNQKLQALNAQLEGINSQAALLQTQAGAGGAIENQLQLESEGRGRTTGGLAPLRADEIRKNNIKLNSLAVQALPLQAQILSQQAVVSGNKALLDSAQKKVDQTFEIYRQDAKDQYDYQVDVFDSISDIVSKEEAKILSEKKTALATNQSMVNDARNFAQQLSSSIFKENPTLASQLAQLIPPDPSSATFTQDLQKYNDKVAQIQRQYVPKTTTPTGATGVVSPITQSIINNPSLFDDLTPTVKGQVISQLQANGYSTSNLGLRGLDTNAINSIAQTQKALDDLAVLKTKIEGKSDLLGPISGLQALNPYSSARQLQADVDRVRQTVGKALEGGVLRKEDEDKYKKILATLTDTPTTAVYKIDALISSIQRDIENYKNLQQSAGRSLDVGAPLQKTGTSTDFRTKYNY